MSIRHYASDVDALDDVTLQMLGSRFRKVALEDERFERPRQRREDGGSERANAHKSPRRPRARHAFE